MGTTTTRKQFVREILDEGDSYPYTSKYQLGGISVNSTGSVDVSITVSTKAGDIVIPIPAGEVYDGDFDNFTTVNVTAGDTYIIELRSI